MATKKPAAPAAAPKNPHVTGIAMWHPDGDCQIGLTSGHTFVIPGATTGVPVPKRFQREAIARGCLPVGMSPEKDEADTFDRGAAIRKTLQAMIEGEDAAAFTGDGKPSLKFVQEKLGFAVDRNELNRAWDDLNKLAEGSDGDDDTPSTLDL